MATISEVEAALDDVSRTIITERQQLKNAKARMTTGEGNLNSIPTVFADAIATINAYTGSDPVVLLAKDKLAKLTTEFQALKGDATSAKNWLAANITEY